MSISLSFRAEETVRENLDRIAASLQRNRNWVINEAIGNYLELYRWQVEHISKGIEASDEGRTHSSEEVRGRLAKRHAQRLAKKPRK